MGEDRDSYLHEIEIISLKIVKSLLDTGTKLGWLEVAAHDLRSEEVLLSRATRLLESNTKRTL